MWLHLETGPFELKASPWVGASFNMTDVLVKRGDCDKDNTDGRTACEGKARRWTTADQERGLRKKVNLLTP